MSATVELIPDEWIGVCSTCICALRYGTSGFPLLPLLPPLPPTPSATPPSMETANGRAAAIPLANTARGWCQFCRFLRRTIPNSRQAQLGNDFRRFDGVHGRSLSTRRPAACCRCHRSARCSPRRRRAVCRLLSRFL